MQYYRQFEPTLLRDGHGHQSCVLLDVDNGCRGECLAGLSVYRSHEYEEAQSHAFQEGFFVIEGEGMALVGEGEFPVSPGTAFLVPAGMPHTIRCAGGCEAVRVFWFHSE